MKSFPVVIDTNLAISLVVSLVSLPVLFTYLHKIKFKKKKIEDKFGVEELLGNSPSEPVMEHTAQP